MVGGAPVQRLTAEDRRREHRNERLRWLAAAAGVVAIVVVFITVLSLGLQHQRRSPQRTRRI